ncbi:hypothetical protein BDB00DRAFT_801582 [Zychaea mexicana]|uniref:uncharacterized protein n=1 Tax=Zychaea mexicana TaxID=64656 RepID=UPI0022FE0184|nr:uncharacterized protein BDB00DRAFT_801582 [Zychaea mexicana]KAI9498201.1 hypothetical protein BDB00DRAFT_801582 [Zychaea mexicana]
MPSEVKGQAAEKRDEVAVNSNNKETLDDFSTTSTKRRFDDIEYGNVEDDDEEEEEELDEFGRVKRRRQKFRSERTINTDTGTTAVAAGTATEKEEGEEEEEEEERYRRSNRRYSDDDDDNIDDNDDDYHNYHRSRYSRRYSSPHYRRRRRSSSSSSRRHHRSSHHYRSDSESADEGYSRRRRRSHHRAYPDNRNPYDAAARYIDTEFFPTKIYIGDLHGVSQDELERIFGRYGPIRQVKMVENKDYAFVTYDDRESAVAAIQSMHGALLGSRHIKVNRAKIPERNQVGFGNVPWTDEDGNLAKEEMRSYPVSREISPLFGSDKHTPPPTGRTLTSYDDL